VAVAVRERLEASADLLSAVLFHQEAPEETAETEETACQEGPELLEPTEETALPESADTAEAVAAEPEAVVAALQEEPEELAVTARQGPQVSS
jgi:hypothetical protein